MRRSHGLMGLILSLTLSACGQSLTNTPTRAEAAAPGERKAMQGEALRPALLPPHRPPDATAEGVPGLLIYRVWDGLPTLRPRPPLLWPNRGAGPRDVILTSTVRPNVVEIRTFNDLMQSGEPRGAPAIHECRQVGELANGLSSCSWQARGGVLRVEQDSIDSSAALLLVNVRYYVPEVAREANPEYILTWGWRL